MVLFYSDMFTCCQVLTMNCSQPILSTLSWLLSQVRGSLGICIALQVISLSLQEMLHSLKKIIITFMHNETINNRFLNILDSKKYHLQYVHLSEEN